MELPYDVAWQYICTPCGRLAGPVYLDEGTFVQGCPCTPGTPRPWPIGDLTQWGEVCACCGQAFFEARTRWSLFFCHPCAERVKDLNDRAGRYVIPIGRHSFHNRWAVPRDDGSPRSALELELFVQKWNGARAAMSAVHDWQSEVVNRVVRERWNPVPARIPLGEYLERRDTSEGERERRFDEMLAYLTEWARGRRA